jgi:hypothetical protein
VQLFDLVKTCYSQDPFCTYTVYNGGKNPNGGWICNNDFFMNTFRFDCKGLCWPTCGGEIQLTNVWGAFCDEWCQPDLCWGCVWGYESLRIPVSDQVTKVGQFFAAD